MSTDQTDTDECHMHETLVYEQKINIFENMNWSSYLSSVTFLYAYNLFIVIIREYNHKDDSKLGFVSCFILIHCSTDIIRTITCWDRWVYSTTDAESSFRCRDGSAPLSLLQTQTPCHIQWHQYHTSVMHKLALWWIRPSIPATNLNYDIN